MCERLVRIARLRGRRTFALLPMRRQTPEGEQTRLDHVTTKQTHLELHILDFALQVLCQQVPRQILYFELFLRLHLESVAVLLQPALEEIDMGVKVRFECVYVEHRSKFPHCG